MITLIREEPRCPTSTRKKSAQTRERLLNAAFELLQSKGSGQLSLQEVAQTARMTTGAAQHHFGLKAALMVETIIQLVDQIDQDKDFWPPPHWSPKRRTDHFVQQAWLQLHSQQLFAVAWSAYLAAREDAVLSAHIIERYTHKRFPELGCWLDGQARVQFVPSCLRGLGLPAPFASTAAIEAQLKVLSATLRSFVQPPETHESAAFQAKRHPDDQPAQGPTCRWWPGDVHRHVTDGHHAF